MRRKADAVSTKADREALASLLQERGVNPTKQRLTIAAHLLHRPCHISVDELRRALVKQDAQVSKATIYNTLGLFVRKGLLRKVLVDRSRVFYDSNTSNHDHFHDVESGLLIDIAPGTIRLNGLPDLPPGTAIDGIETIIRLRRIS
ncbi:Fur family transcriptional regulator [Thioalkalivibrio sp. HK1]|uniref:Fur family transcriptional regulator n=1 Tax=Thioalkalivibrio sp. HK1 TaxID=1469245 RepID=UPI00046FCA28|nr:transcriptional repressor [Thioalkalivibrio sp. HK1]